MSTVKPKSSMVYAPIAWLVPALMVRVSVLVPGAGCRGPARPAGAGGTLASPTTERISGHGTRHDVGLSEGSSFVLPLAAAARVLRHLRLPEAPWAVSRRHRGAHRRLRSGVRRHAGSG